jgi:hypothetical protein
LDLFLLATHCNVVINADSDEINSDSSAFGVGNKQEEGIIDVFSRSQTLLMVFGALEDQKKLK